MNILVSKSSGLAQQTVYICLPRLMTLLLMLGLWSCGGTTTATRDATAQTVQLLQKEMESLRERVSLLESSLPLLSCGPELRALLRDIRTECNAGNAKPFEQKSGKGSSAIDSSGCQADQLSGAITTAERDSTRPIGQMLISLLRHEVVYVSDNGNLSSVREKRLASLAAEPRLRSTRFLVVTAPTKSVQDGERRAHRVVNRLIELGVPAEEIDEPWIYQLRVSQQMLRPADRAIPPEPRDWERAVYVFRADC